MCIERRKKQSKNIKAIKLIFLCVCVCVYVNNCLLICNLFFSLKKNNLPLFSSPFHAIFWVVAGKHLEAISQLIMQKSQTCFKKQQ